MTDLIARLESATKETSALMWECFSEKFPDGTVHETYMQFAGFLDAGAYLDAALTLVPEGLKVELTIHEDGIGHCVLLQFDETVCKRQVVAESTAQKPTPALAVCAAALRARKESRDDSH